MPSPHASSAATLRLPSPAPPRPRSHTRGVGTQVKPPRGLVRPRQPRRHLHELREVVHRGDQPLPLPRLVGGRRVLRELGRGLRRGRRMQLQGKARSLVLGFFTQLKAKRAQVSPCLSAALFALGLGRVGPVTQDGSSHPEHGAERLQLRVQVAAFPNPSRQGSCWEAPESRPTSLRLLFPQELGSHLHTRTPPLPRQGRTAGSTCLICKEILKAEPSAEPPERTALLTRCLSLLMWRSLAIHLEG